MIEIFTIGVYNSTEESYFGKLMDAKIDLFCDIRQRRGVRGSLYKYVNSNYLQAKLNDLGIDYMYIKALAPTKEIRMKQKEADKLKGETKHKRTTLGDVFIAEYQNQILNKFDLEGFVKEIESKGYKKVAFFCVEEKAEACHRSLVAKRNHRLFSYPLINL